ncbi:MAG: hypothetical protein AB1941_04815 [Gemmatimonadota bacterium]
MRLAAPGPPKPLRLRRLGFALSLAGLALALRIAVQTVRDHGRDEPAANTVVQP